MRNEPLFLGTHSYKLRSTKSSVLTRLPKGYGEALSKAVKNFRLVASLEEPSAVICFVGNARSQKSHAHECQEFKSKGRMIDRPLGSFLAKGSAGGVVSEINLSDITPFRGLDKVIFWGEGEKFALKSEAVAQRDEAEIMAILQGYYDKNPYFCPLSLLPRG